MRADLKTRKMRMRDLPSLHVSGVQSKEGTFCSLFLEAHTVRLLINFASSLLFYENFSMH